MQATLLPINVAAEYLDPASICRAERVCSAWRARLLAQDVQDHQWFPWIKRLAKSMGGKRQVFVEGRKWKKFWIAVRGIRELLGLANPSRSGQ